MSTPRHGLTNKFYTGLQLQSLSADSEGILFQAYRDTQGTDGGAFGTVVRQRHGDRRV